MTPVLITDLTTAKGPGRGKLDPDWHLPVFRAELAAAGIGSATIGDAAALAARLSAGPRAILVHIYNEEQPLGALAALPDAARSGPHVFNPLTIVSLIRDKRDTWRHLDAAGIALPERAEGAAAAWPVFSNQTVGSNAPVRLIAPGDSLPRARYNTRFIDSARTFRGRAYFCCIRLMCVGQELVAAMVRLRPTDQGDPSVHTRNTPRDPALIGHFQHLLVDSRIDALRALAAQIGAALPPAFLAHDIVPEAGTDRLYLCETGLKFEDYSYRRHLAPIAADLPASLAPLFGEAFIRASARAFLREAARRGMIGSASSATGQGGAPGSCC